MIKFVQRIIDLRQPISNANPTLTRYTEIGMQMEPQDSALRSQYERIAKHQALIEAEDKACKHF